MNLFGESDPLGSDGYVPGAWDEVRAAHIDGHISDDAYSALYRALEPLCQSATDQKTMRLIKEGQSRPNLKPLAKDPAIGKFKKVFE